MDRRIETLLATAEIRDAVTDYCRALDRCDAERAKHAFHPDAQEEHASFSGLAHDFIDMAVRTSAATWEGSVRKVVNVSVEVNGNGAESETDFIGVMRDPVKDLFVIGRHVDRWERRQGAWKIARRLAIVDWWRQEVRNALPFSDGAEAVLRFANRGLEDAGVRAVLGLPAR